MMRRMISSRTIASRSVAKLMPLEAAMVHSENMVVTLGRAVEEQEQVNMQVRQLGHMYSSQKRMFTPNDLEALQTIYDTNRHLLKTSCDAAKVCHGLVELYKDTDANQVRFVETKLERIRENIWELGSSSNELGRLLDEARR